MSESKWVREVGNADFETQVVAASREVPVLVDFWAAWCGPCRVLGPVLERVADDLDGKLIVAKVDTEANQKLAMQFQIRGIPACKLFVGGEVVDEFVGALPEAAVREFVARHVKSDVDLALAAAAEARRGGDLEAAGAALAPLLDKHPSHAGALLEGARHALASGEIELVRKRAGAIGMDADQYDAAQALLGAAELADVCRKAGQLEPASKANAGETAARYATGACHATAGDYESALEVMLDIVKTDRRYGDDAARKAMLVVFGLCEDDSLVRDYRRRLSILI